MIRSMTGFASVERQYEFGRLTWELRSVNHRYLEIGLRLPEEFRVLEPDIRRTLGEYLSRGKVDAALRFSAAPGATRSSLALNHDLLETLLELHAEVGRASGSEEAADPMALLRWPGVIEEQAPDPQPLQAAAMELLGDAATSLQSARGREGEEMVAAIRERLDSIESWWPRCASGCPKFAMACEKSCSPASPTCSTRWIPAASSRKSHFWHRKSTSTKNSTAWMPTSRKRAWCSNWMTRWVAGWTS